MSTRWYPLYCKGAPQLRVFLPNFWLKLAKPKFEQPPNVVQFIVSMEMTKHDVRNYLEKIYKIPVIEVRTYIQIGEFKKDTRKGYVTKDEDYKVAFVTMPEGEEFKFPNLFEKEEEKAVDDKKSIDEMKKGYKNFLDKAAARPGMPGWFPV